MFLAHRDPATGREQSIVAHLKGTATLASVFADFFGCQETAYDCARLHDIGKYSAGFQRRITGGAEKVDHTTAGTQEAFRAGNPAVAFCIAGHHGGLPDLGSQRADTPADRTLRGKLKRRVGVDIEEYRHCFDDLSPTVARPPAKFLATPQMLFFHVHMLFSCLVDSDFLDTESFMRDGAVSRGGHNSIPELVQRLDEKINLWWNAATPINQKRCQILQAAMNAAARQPGLFSLTVPTGGGKTMSSMAFALRHCEQHCLRRVIYVIPYTSILEQTQQEFEKVFGAENVIAHYANVDYSNDENAVETDRRRLASENWDAPIILTTAVQFFESLFGSKPSKCRKLHNISASVLVFDEAQMLPIDYLHPCIYGIAQLVEHYRCSAVLCTATQPSLQPLFKRYLPAWPVRELCPDRDGMVTFFRRVHYLHQPELSDEQLAERLMEHQQVLCIVNSRKQAQTLLTMLAEEGTYHLSTTMPPICRRGVLHEIKRRLPEGKPCRLVATSLVEAGVDLDFPVVYRAIAGLDSMIQAAGRCNRENKRTADESPVILFETAQKPPRMLEQNIAAARQVLRDQGDIASPAAIEQYFDLLYYQLRGDSQLDRKSIMQDIDSGQYRFASIAERFKLIENAQRTIYIPIGEGATLVRQLQEFGPSRALMRKLGQYAVGVYERHFADLWNSGALEMVSQDAAILLDMQLYHDKTGLALFVEEAQGYIL